MKAGAHFQKRRDPSVNLCIAGCWGSDARKDLKQGTFAGSVTTNDAHHFRFFDFEGDIFESPNDLYASTRPTVTAKNRLYAIDQLIAQSIRASCVDLVLLGEILYSDYTIAHLIVLYTTAVGDA